MAWPLQACVSICKNDNTDYSLDNASTPNIVQDQQTKESGGSDGRGRLPLIINNKSVYYIPCQMVGSIMWKIK